MIVMLPVWSTSFASISDFNRIDIDHLISIKVWPYVLKHINISLKGRNMFQTHDVSLQTC